MADQSLLRFLTCGSVDDGKSTLIGRLLYDSKLIHEDHLAALEADSKKVGTRGDDLDFALLVDGLAAEREQGITIDVAYRFFTTPRRSFIVADTPGHEQYTRNMATGASTSDLAVILVDARKGVLTQTRRHTYLASLLGISHVVLAVNKLDLVEYSRDVFDRIVEDHRCFTEELGFVDVTAIPMSAARGDNVAASSIHTDWYEGPSLLGHLESVEVGRDRVTAALRMPVQWVNRPSLDFRGYSGQIVSGRLCPGDPVVVAPSNRPSRIERIVTFDGDLDEAVAGQSVTVTLADAIDVSRGDVLVAAGAPCKVADRFRADVVWMDDAEMLPGRSYLLKVGATTAQATLAAPRHRVDVNTMEHFEAETLTLNEIGECDVTLDRPVPFDAYHDDRHMGGFILVDRVTNATVAAGMLRSALRQSSDVHWQPTTVDKSARAAAKDQKPAVVWFTGLSGAGKSTIADIVESKLHGLGRHTYLLDGDNVRFGLNRDLGFSDADRVENLRRVTEVAALMADAGLIVLVSFISPFRSERRAARERIGEGEFVEVFVDTPLAVAESRDVKGLYAKARRGELANFTGIDSPYEPPEAPEITIDTTARSPEEAADAIVDRLLGREPTASVSR